MHNKAHNPHHQWFICHMTSNQVQSHPKSYLQGSNVIIGDVSLLGDSQRNIRHKGCIGGLKLLLRLFDLYWWCSGVHPIDVPVHSFLDGGRKILVVHDSSNDELYGDFGVGHSCARFWRRKRIYPKNSSGNKMDYNWFRNTFERHGRLGIPEMFLDGPVGLLNIVDMLLPGFSTERYSNTINFFLLWFKLTIRMYVVDLETAMQVYPFYLLYYIINVLYF